MALSRELSNDRTMRLMKAAVLYGAQDIRIDERPAPKKPGPERVTVRVRAVGLCGSDLSYYQKGGVSAPLQRPLVLGHEAAGDVVAVGPRVTGVAVGDRVSIEPGSPCWRCEACRSGQYNLCPLMSFMGSRSGDGALQEYVDWPAGLVHPILPTLSYEDAALVEPVSVAFAAVARARISLGDRVLILGSGAIGLATLQLARAAGASFVAVSDMRVRRVALARQLGADQVIDIGSLGEGALPLPDGSIGTVVDTTGSARAIAQAHDVVKPGGSLVLVGLSHETLPLSILQLVYRQYAIYGVYRYSNTFTRVIDLMTDQRIAVAPLITHRFPLAEIEAALITASHGDDAVKVMIHL